MMHDSHGDLALYLPLEELFPLHVGPIGEGGHLSQPVTVPAVAVLPYYAYSVSHLCSLCPQDRANLCLP